MPTTETHNRTTPAGEDKLSQRPFFSVVLPTRNRPELFERALESVLKQSFQNFEVLVVNDGSDDGNLERYKELETTSDPRVRWHYQPQRPNGHGPSYSINTGAQLARGLYLCILDDDDSWTTCKKPTPPSTLQAQWMLITATKPPTVRMANP